MKFNIALLALALSLAGAARAEMPNEAEDTAWRLVSFVGLDLTKPGDQTLLHHRAVIAAYQVCREVTNGNGMTDAGYSACFEAAMRGANLQIATRIAAARDKGQVASNGAK